MGAFRKFTKETGAKGILVGVRHSDPYGQIVSEICPTDNGWPDFLRVHPILHWSYHDIWNFLKKYHLPYCKLYDEGYTSLGDLESTQPNPNLVLPDGRYSPAWMLKDEKLERESRPSMRRFN